MRMNNELLNEILLRRPIFIQNIEGALVQVAPVSKEEAQKMFTSQPDSKDLSIFFDKKEKVHGYLYLGTTGTTLFYFKEVK